AVPLELALRAAEVIAGRGAATPREQLAEALLPADAGREAEHPARPLDVRGAVPDVTAPELPGHARLEIFTARGRRERAADVADAAQLAAAEVHHHAVGAIGLERQQGRVGDVVHRDEVAALAPVLVDHWLLPGEQAGQEDREHAGVGVAERLA